MRKGYTYLTTKFLALVKAMSMNWMAYKCLFYVIVGGDLHLDLAFNNSCFHQLFSILSYMKVYMHKIYDLRLTSLNIVTIWNENVKK